MNLNDSQYEKILNYLFSAQKPFNIDDIFTATKIKKNAEVREEISLFLDSIDDFVNENDIYYPKNTFITDIPIRIKPTDYEIKQNILIIGHRIIPFYPSGYEVSDVFLMFNGKPLKTKEIKLKMNELLIYFNLMNFEKIPFINVEDILEPQADLRIEAFNLKSFYAKHAFKSGDTIILRTAEFNEGIFSIEYDSLEDMQANFSTIQKQDRAFINMLKKIMDREMPSPNTEKQLLYTYFYLKKAGKDNWDCNQAGTALGPLLSQREEIRFSPLHNGKVVFHFASQSLDQLNVYPDFSEMIDMSSPEETDLESIDGIFAFLNNTHGLTTVRAILFQQITFQEKYNYQAVEDYIFTGITKPYMPEEIQKKFRVLVDKEYKQIKDNFDLKHAFLPITTLRTKILDNMLEIASFMRHLDSLFIPLDELPKNSMLHLMDMDRSFYEILMELEQRQLSGHNDASELHPLNKVIDSAAKLLPMIFDSIRNELGIEP